MITDRGRSLRPGPAPEAASPNLPNFPFPNIVTTVHEEGRWKIGGPGAPGEDNFGDGQMIVDADAGLYRLAYRSGGAVNGCVYAEKTLNGDPYSGWSIAGGVVTPTKSFPGVHLTNNVNVDTAALVVNPDTDVITVTISARPGSLSELEEGYIYSIQRRTNVGTTNLWDPANWADYGGTHLLEVNPAAPWEDPRLESAGPPPKYTGGVQEGSIFYDAANDQMVLMYEAKSADVANPEWGTSWKNRLGRAVASMVGFDTAPVFVRTPTPGATSWVFDVETQPGYVPSPMNDEAIWGLAPGETHQAHFSINPSDGVWHMVRLGKKANTGAGNRNRSTGIGHWYSLDEGFTWVADVNNPIINWDSMGFTDNGLANKLNSPYLMWTPTKVYLAFWGNDNGVNTLGSRHYMAEAAL